MPASTDPIAFRAASADLTGATVCLNGATFDVAAALAAGGGTLTVDTSEAVLIDALRALPAVVEVPAEPPKRSRPPAKPDPETATA